MSFMRHNERAFALIEILIGATIIVVAGAAIASSYGFIAKYTRFNRMISDKIAARTAVLTAFDCTTILPSAAGCTSNHSVPLLDFSGAPLAGSAGQIGSWKLSARCAPGKGIVVDGTWTGGTTHPLTGVPIVSSPLFPSGINFCRDAIVGKAPVVSKSALMSNTGYLCASNTSSPTYRSWESTIACPSGYIAAGGGIDCGYNALQQASTPTGPGFSSWYGKCCAAPGTGYKVYVTCALAD